MDAPDVDGRTQTQAREYVDRAEEAGDAVEEKMRTFEEHLSQTN